MVRLVVTLSVVLITLPACTQRLTGSERQDYFAKGTAAYDAGNYQAALTYWEPLAAQDDVAAMRNIGHIYRRGLGVARDPQKAASFYRRAAKLGFASAQYNMAVMHLRGNGLPLDRPRGTKWMAKAAAQNYQPAINWQTAQRMRVYLFENKPAH